MFCHGHFCWDHSGRSSGFGICILNWKRWNQYQFSSRLSCVCGGVRGDRQSMCYVYDRSCEMDCFGIRPLFPSCVGPGMYLRIWSSELAGMLFLNLLASFSRMISLCSMNPVNLFSVEPLLADYSPCTCSCRRRHLGLNRMCCTLVCLVKDLECPSTRIEDRLLFHFIFTFSESWSCWFAW